VERRVLHVDWLVSEDGPLLKTPGRVALSSCPGRTDVGGDVESDVQHLQLLDISVVVSLVTDVEMDYYGAVGLRRELRAANVHSVQFPIEDTQPPKDLLATQALCRNILGWLEEGKNVLIHCIGGWGRSGTIAAALLTHQGYEADAAIELVREARSPRCVESRAQERFVREYARRHQQDASPPRTS
jgi:protein-tyrosine phosphatase